MGILVFYLLMLHTFLMFRNRDFNVDHLPTNLKIMRTNSHFTTTALDHLPCMLTELSLGLNHPYSLDHLPSSLLKLFINESAFNQPLDHLPPSLQVLRLQRYNFNAHFLYLKKLT